MTEEHKEFPDKGDNTYGRGRTVRGGDEVRVEVTRG